MDTKEKEESTFADFRMRYSVCVEDIRYVKSRQWSVTYYLILLFAAIIGFAAAQGSDLRIALRILLSIMGLIVALTGTCFLCQFQKDLAKYRRRLVYDILPNLSETFQFYEAKAHKEGLNETDKKNWRENYSSQRKGLTWIGTLAVFLWAAWVFVTWYLFGYLDP